MACAPMWIDIKPFLASVALFEGMKPEELAHIASGAKQIHTTRGGIIFRKDEPCSGLYLLIYGQVKLFFVSPQGHEKILDIVDQGQTFGESSLFQEKNHQLYAQTLVDCHLVHISKPVITAELEKNPAFARRVIDCLARRLFELTEDVESYSHDSGQQRLANYLLREAQRAMPDVHRAEQHMPNSRTFEPGRNSLSLTLQSSKGVIASRLNMSQEHFSRLLHELSECKLLTVDGRQIHIKDLAQLRQFTGRSALPLAHRQQVPSTRAKAPLPPFRNRDAQLERVAAGLFN